MTDKQYLVQAFETGLERGHRYYAVQVEIASQSDYETIINTIESAHDKLQYYVETYKDDLTHVHAGDKVRICGYLTTNDWDEIRMFLVDDEDLEEVE